MFETIKNREHSKYHYDIKKISCLAYSRTIKDSAISQGFNSGLVLSAGRFFVAFKRGHCPAISVWAVRLWTQFVPVEGICPKMYCWEIIG